MIRGLYTSVSGLVAADARQQVLASHLANADTPGYKTDDVTNESFEQVLAALFDQTQPGTGNRPSDHRRLVHVSISLVTVNLRLTENQK